MIFHRITPGQALQKPVLQSAAKDPWISLGRALWGAVALFLRAGHPILKVTF